MQIYVNFRQYQKILPKIYILDGCCGASLEVHQKHRVEAVVVEVGIEGGIVAGILVVAAAVAVFEADVEDL